MYLLISIALCRTAWLHPGTSYVGNIADPQESMWFLEWTPFSVSHAHSPWTSDFMNYPHGLNLMWNTFTPLAALVIWPITATLGVVVAYNVLITLAFASAAWCAWLALRYLRMSPGASFAGGLLYGFSPYMIGQAGGHLHLVLAFFPPLLLLCVYETVIRQRHSPVLLGLLLGLLCVAEFFTSEELLLDGVVAAVCSVAILALFARDAVASRLPYVARVIGSAVVTSAVLLAWPLSVQFFGPERPIGVNHPKNTYVADLLSFVLPTQNQLIAPSAAVAHANGFSGNPAETTAYLGIPLIILLGFAVWRYWRTRLVRVTSLTALLMAVFAMGSRLHVDGRTTSIPLPWAAVVRLPLLSDALPVRFMVYFYLLAAVLVAVCVSRLSASGARDARASMVAAAAVTVALLPLLPHVPLPASTVTLPQFFSSSRDVSQIPVESTVLTAPFPYRDIVAVSSLVWQAQSGMRYKIVGGYWIGPDPPHTVTPQLERVLTDLGSTGVDETTPALLPALRLELRAACIRTIVVTPGPYAAREADLFARLLNRAPAHELDVLVWWNVNV
ncbi:MAG: hypothetical protein DLM65_04585 [Candidatus Aeolococcus gillhamiae]|uniref:Glycosyltransferase RgtA/B/C/D-like domain-containing protein n=1 Tax=Candidatus Aeolococcus gillhamiae TaxID=3127015 RepID=A0A2W5Z9Q1_9BACT|nr:MAG: hypothetical protein DLM65_04585 [Candidatus Dormibacter sp. RRmetagenome_bin12]